MLISCPFLYSVLGTQAPYLSRLSALSPQLREAAGLHLPSLLFSLSLPAAHSLSVSWGRCGPHLICFLSLKDHCPLSPDNLHLQNHCVIFLVLFFGGGGGVWVTCVHFVICFVLSIFSPFAQPWHFSAVTTFSFIGSSWSW